MTITELRSDAITTCIQLAMMYVYCSMYAFLCFTPINYDDMNHQHNINMMIVKSM